MIPQCIVAGISEGGIEMAPEIVERVKDILSIFMAAVAIFAGLCTIYEAMHARAASAGLLLAVTVVTTALFYFPHIESLKTPGVEITLRKTLDRAEEIIEQMRRLATANAKISALTLAWSNRLGSPTAAQKQEAFDETRRELLALKVPESKMRDISWPVVRMIGVDLYSVYFQTVWRFAQGVEHRSAQQLSKDPSKLPVHQEIARHVQEWNARTAGHSLGDVRDASELRQNLLVATPTMLMNEDQRAAAAKLTSQIVDLYIACVAKGGYTNEATEFLDRYRDLGDWNQLSRELFGVAYD